MQLPDISIMVSHRVNFSKCTCQIISSLYDKFHSCELFALCPQPLSRVIILSCIRDASFSTIVVELPCSQTRFGGIQSKFPARKKNYAKDEGRKPQSVSLPISQWRLQSLSTSVSQSISQSVSKSACLSI